MNSDKYIIFAIILIAVYHFVIHNGLEKIFFETHYGSNYDTIRRPLKKCSEKTCNNPLKCIGMPSGHAETITIVALLLYNYEIIPLWVCLTLIFIISSQRVTSGMHTLGQVFAGMSVGLLYYEIYKYFDLSPYSYIIVFLIGLSLSYLSVMKVDNKIQGVLPDWIDKTMLDNINKKRNSPLYSKIQEIYINSIVQGKTFMTWQELEQNLDIIVNNIRNSGKKYDAVVGIKTGGAIISDYISKKLDLPNYKIKLTNSKYKCNKKPFNAIDSIISNQMEFDSQTYDICEGISDDLENKNIILIDENVSSGKTMEESYNYLLNYKKVNNIYPVCVSFLENFYKGKIKINYATNIHPVIWPWGYDN